MNILVIGSGGREHALCWKIKQSPKTADLYCMPGNGGTSEYAVNCDVDILDNDAIKNFCKEKKIDLVVVGPEVPLSRGITDVLETEGIRVCGPSYAASRLESSKIFAKELMGRYNIPTAGFRIFETADKAEAYLREIGTPVVIKADGLAAGKGVIVAKTVPEAMKAAKEILEDKVFGSAGNKIIIEECLEGEEVSILVMSDGKNIISLASSQDHKRIYDGDKGPNTGGMGAYSPAPVVDKKLFNEINKTIIRPIIDGLAEEGTPYKGVLYAGVMITDLGVKVLEFNVRFGDPETQAILPRLKTDLVELLMATASGDISGIRLKWDKRDCVAVVLASGGYPGKYEKARQITGIDDAEKEGVVVFHAGTMVQDGTLLTSGGRVLSVAGMGLGIKKALEHAYAGVDRIHFEGMTYRRDIAHRAVERLG
ncbi:MAG: phosphoribosylamine--glycine ligase [Candidatus Omnitrophica bacterium]|nr:phosphoribosylamine--glycine ligase [Candidatus Omnitrophota bacterium]MBU1128953.1 phosphoribosylamine--glycine ligase [Candidatus Omnitrophota bacterium]MBU1657148.1 phosphoribosylamine--glycine ligase [Candidatus Omnitrophota bacterium]MBU1784102.1 phosphoribosylamine--glycine ligase [Candidatus Omnitrophota bacterium]MBU1850832.1 phosphoribosylamine--glycine ligase [Candidatus Omnitrophota bacterium]